MKQEDIKMKQLSDGTSIPCIGLGTFGSDHFSAEQVANAVYAAIRCGYRLLDCASVYGNEALIGKTLERAYAESLVAREDLFIQSKVWNDMHGDGDVLISLAQTLKDLRTDYLDAYYLHWPLPNFHLAGCSVESRSPDAKPFSVERFMRTWRQLERLAECGLVRRLGMSNMTVWKLKQVLPLCRVRPQLIEMELHPSFQQKELYDYCVKEGIMPVGYCPVGSPSRPERDKTPEDISDIEMPEIVAIAKAHNVHPAIVCIKWAVQRGQIPIPFSVNAEHCESNLRCTAEDPLTDEEMKIISSLDCNNRLIKGQVFLWKGEDDWLAVWDEKK